MCVYIHIFVYMPSYMGGVPPMMGSGGIPLEEAPDGGNLQHHAVVWMFFFANIHAFMYASLATRVDVFLYACLYFAGYVCLNVCVLVVVVFIVIFAIIIVLVVVFSTSSP